MIKTFEKACKSSREFCLKTQMQPKAELLKVKGAHPLLEYIQVLGVNSYIF